MHGFFIVLVSVNSYKIMLLVINLRKLKKTMSTMHLTCHGQTLHMTCIWIFVHSLKLKPKKETGKQWQQCQWIWMLFTLPLIDHLADITNKNAACGGGTDTAQSSKMPYIW